MAPNSNAPNAPTAGHRNHDAGRQPLEPDPIAASHGMRVAAHIRAQIEAAGGWIGFDRYMDLALYAPALGYYAAGAAKFGADGDFITAPQISPLFARALASQVAQLLDMIGSRPAQILEFGAGTGALGAELLAELQRRGVAVDDYLIVELSPDLRQRQRAALAAWPVSWLDRPPVRFRGVVLANEVLDVMPVKLFVRGDGAIDRDGALYERGVTLADAPDPHSFRFALRPAPADLAAAVAQIEAAFDGDAGAGRHVMGAGYGSEVGLVARAWVRSLGEWLERGAALLIDYGFPGREYYHPQRLMGTLMCHYRHRAHADPLWWPGLNDITAHVDFSAAAAAAHGVGLDILGYTSQARFLLNCGIIELLRHADMHATAAPAALRLLSEAEMGELFKVLAVGRGLPRSLVGFAQGDRTDRL